MDRSITARNLGLTFGGLTNALHSFVLQRATRHVLEIEDVHFHYDSAVLLPDNPPEDERTAPPSGPAEPRVTSAAVLARCLRTAEANPTWRLLITGHADTAGRDSYNVTLSQQRADTAHAVLVGDKALFRRTALAHNRLEDSQRILTWLARDWGWTCDPGGIDNQSGPLTSEAVRAFKRTYNAEFAGALPITPAIDAATWDAFFDCYQRELREVLNVDDAGLTALRGHLQFFDASHDAVGCGENWPIENPARPNFRSVADRRIELVFFEDSDLPRLDCHQRRGACDARHCQVYDPRFFTEEFIPVDPVLPRIRRVAVHLALSWTDPEATAHRFPGDMSVIVDYRDGVREDLQLDANGVLAFIADRTHGAFTLRFEPGDDRYIASAPAGSAEAPPERLVAVADAERLAADHAFRIWRLPARYSLTESTWAADAGAPSYAAPWFELTPDTIGTPSTPAGLVLDPRWQFLRIEYFDRRYGASDHGNRRIAVPPVLLAGSRTAPATGNGPIDTRSNWTVGTDQPTTAAQALPWVLQRHADNTADARPAPGIMLHFVLPGHSFVVARSATERVIEVITDAARLGPSAARLALYDLPEVWRARSYQARPSDGTPAIAFESLTQAQLDASLQRAQPIAFCLDDIVLRIDDASVLLLPPGGGAPQPRLPAWNPANMTIAVFSNTLLNGPNPQDVGPFQPDTANNASYVTQHTGRLAAAANIVYVSDYPDWTRVVIYEGDVYEAFDQRLPVGSDGPGQVVGARLAICHQVSSTLQAPGANPTRPAVQRGGDHFVSQVFFEQQHDLWTTRSATDTTGIGRCDLALLRCCGVEADGVTEQSQLLVYFRFFVNFNPTFQPSFNQGHATALGLAGAAAATWIDAAMRNIPRRWTGPDGAYNSGPAFLVPASGAPQLQVRTVWFCQHVRRAIAHYELGMFQPTLVTDPSIRAYMNSHTGIGVLDQGDNQPGVDGWFTAAHESGHGSSVGDEYIENTAPVGFLGGFDSYSPGSPFALDVRAMMRSDKEVRPRYFWHLAEWLRALYATDFEVRHGGFQFALPHHTGAPAQSHVNWPLAQQLDATHGAHGKFDIFFYPLGAEDYSVNVLPRAVRPGTPAFDGLFVIVVKLEFNFQTAVQATIDGVLKPIDQQIRFRLNNRWMASCTVGGRRYERCLVTFAPRYWASNYSTKAPRDTSHHFLVTQQDGGPPDWHDTIFGLFDARHKLDWPLNQGAFVFAQYFAEMCGLPHTATPAAADFEPIVRKVAPDARVSAI